MNKPKKRFIGFTYTKSNGEVSDRIGFIIEAPSHLYRILDLTEYSDDEREEIIEEYCKIHDMLLRFYRQVPFKTFKAEGISNIVELEKTA